MSITVALVLIITSILVWLNNRFQKHPLYKTAIKLPGNRIYPFVGTLFTIVGNGGRAEFFVERHKKFKTGYREYGALYNKFHFFPANAREVEIFLNSTKHIEKNEFYKFLRPLIGDGLLINSGKKWKKRRKLLTPSFHFSMLQKFLPIFQSESVNFVNSLKTEDGCTDFENIIERFTLNTICATAMGIELNNTNNADIYRNNIRTIVETTGERSANPILHFDFLFNLTPDSRKINKSSKITHAFVRNIITEQREKFAKKQELQPRGQNENLYEHKKYAMLDSLFQAETTNDIDEQGILDEVETFIFEGFDTTSTGILFSTLLIATHTDVQEQIYLEIQEINVMKNGEDWTINDYNETKLLDRVIKESLRLYPPVPLFSRKLLEECDIGGGVILPAGCSINLMIYCIHRDAEQFPDPETFNPDRFLPENIAKRHPFAYVPFSAGPRNCIGQKFAMLEMKSVIVQMISKYRMEAITKIEDIKFYFKNILTPDRPVHIKFIKRV